MHQVAKEGRQSESDSESKGNEITKTWGTKKEENKLGEVEIKEND